MTADERPPITDSPWFWLLLFSLVGLAALAAIHGKYGRRQAGIERQYQARERTAEQVAALARDGVDADTTGSDVPLPEYSSADHNLIPMWPLFIALAAVAVFAAVMLRRERQGRGRGRPGSPTDPAE